MHIKWLRPLPLLVIFSLETLAFADAPAPKTPAPAITQREDTARFETTPWVKKVDIINTSGLLRVIVKASAPTDCYKEREIERIFEKNIVKIILRLKRPVEIKDCVSKKLFDYEEKVYESSLEGAPSQVWILGHEGWHKLKVQKDGKLL